MAEVKQNIVKCPNNHYYDANRYKSCPFCSGEMGTFLPTSDPYGGMTVPPTGGVYQGGGVTVSPTGGVDYMGSGLTVPPETIQGSDIGHTQFVDDSTPAGSLAPVVGWLVAVSGPCRGTDYRIHTGYNYIGRERGDIVINGDMGISGEKDSVIAYSPQDKRFYIGHEQGKNLISVNNGPVIGGSTELHLYDRIVIGNTKLVFVPLCGDGFSWGDAE